MSCLYSLNSVAIDDYQSSSNGILDHRFHETFSKFFYRLEARQFFHEVELRKLGSGKEGIVYGGHIDGRAIFAVKISSTEKIIREIAVGRKLNELRDKVPTFVYCYGSITANYPIFNESSDDIIGWNAIPFGQSPHGIFEYIQNSVPLAELSKNIKDSELVDILIQLFSSLQLAYEHCDYTHYDLHSNNVLVQYFKEKVIVPVYIDGKIKRMATNYVPRIIDNGCAHWVENGEHYGEKRLRDFGVMNNRSYPAHDIYKLILTSVGVSPMKIYTLKKLYYFFNEVDDKGNQITMVERVKRSNADVTDLSQPDEKYREKYSTITYNEYLSWLINNTNHSEIIQSQNILDEVVSPEENIEQNSMGASFESDTKRISTSKEEIDLPNEGVVAVGESDAKIDVIRDREPITPGDFCNIGKKIPDDVKIRELDNIANESNRIEKSLIVIDVDGITDYQQLIDMCKEMININRDIRRVERRALIVNYRMKGKYDPLYRSLISKIRLKFREMKPINDADKESLISDMINSLYRLPWY